jgi:hypothetical protein
MGHKSRRWVQLTHFQVMEGRGRIGVVNDDIEHLLGPEGSGYDKDSVNRVLR